MITSIAGDRAARLANFGDRLSAKAASELERMGVQIQCHTSSPVWMPSASK